MAGNLEVARQTEEWTYHEDDSGIVYCLGRKIDQDVYEAVAAYERSPGTEGFKRSLDSDSTYSRLMYHGFPEEDTKLSRMRPDTRAALIGNLSLRDRCIFIDPAGMVTANPLYRTIDAWLSNDDSRMNPFNQALESACETMARAGISVEGAELYGGAAYGLVSKPEKRVDDVDFILKVSSEELYAGAYAMQQPIKWRDIDPQSILSERRQMLKAKRWSTSQIRTFDPEFLSIDLKAARDPGRPSLWDEIPKDAATREFEGELKVVNDSEAYCISPAVICEDRKGNQRTVLFRGYPYIGCAVVGDTIGVRASAYEESNIIIVTQSANDRLTPDFSNVAIS